MVALAGAAAEEINTAITAPEQPAILSSAGNWPCKL